MRKAKDFIGIIIVLLVIGSAIYKIAHRSITNHLVKDNAILIKAVIIDKKNFTGNDKVHPEFTYSYEFTINGKNYTGDSHDSRLKIGDSIEVQYVKDSPGFNKPLHSAE